MKVVFPSTGILVLQKEDLSRLKSYYNLTLAQSPFRQVYETSNNIIQVEQFNYLPPRSSIILKNANPLSIEKMRDLMEQSKKAYEEKVEEAKKEKAASKKIDDREILSNPFFTTFRQIS